MVVNKGDNVTVHFYNVDPNKTERHSFTIGAPYNIDLDLAGGGESAVANFTADHEGIFQYYCKYHLPVMTGQLQVVPWENNNNNINNSIELQLPPFSLFFDLIIYLQSS